MRNGEINKQNKQTKCKKRIEDKKQDNRFKPNHITNYVGYTQTNHFSFLKTEIVRQETRYAGYEQHALAMKVVSACNLGYLEGWGRRIIDQVLPNLAQPYSK